jgi:hypothetical protein
MKAEKELVNKCYELYALLVEYTNKKMHEKCKYVRECPACHGLGADMNKTPIPVTISIYDNNFNRIGENSYPYVCCPYCSGLGWKEACY